MMDRADGEHLQHSSPRHNVTNVECWARGDKYEVAAAYTVYQTDQERLTRLFNLGRYLDA